MPQLQLFLPANLPRLSATAEDLKEQAIRKVTRNMRDDWRSRALEALHTLALVALEFTADDFREVAARYAIGEPHHPNAWAAVMNHGHRLGWYQPTGYVRKSERRPAHSRLVPVWRSRIFQARRSA